MKIKNYEYSRSSGLPLSGLTVEAWDAVDGTPGGAPIASTVTDGNGMWEFTGLTNTPKDIKVTNSGLYHWYKGASRHSLGRLLLSEGIYAPGIVNNRLINPGLEFWQSGAGPFTTLNKYTADCWILYKGGSSTISVSRDSGNVDPGSNYCAALNGTIVDSAVGIFQKVDDPAQYKNKKISVGFRVKCSTANAVYAFISDDAGVTNTQSAKHSGSGSYETLTVEDFTVSASVGTTNLWIGILFALTATAYVDNAVLNFGSVSMPYEPNFVADDLRNIERYRQLIGGSANYPYISFIAVSGGQAHRNMIPFRQKMAGVPTVTQSGTWTKNPGGLSDPSIEGVNQDGFVLRMDSFVSGPNEATPNTALITAEYIP